MTTTPVVGTTFFGLDVSRLSDQLLHLRRRVSKRVLLLEFAPGLLRLAEAVLTPDGVQLNHISKVSLPDEALERCVPADPAKMAGLLKEVCREKGIPAHRVAVVLSPEAAFQRLVDLPAELTTEQAREFVLDPANGVQIPFPLAQTDFDLVPVVPPPMANRPKGMRLYMLSAIPQVLVDQVIEMLRLADLELHLLELGSFSQLRPIAADLITLPPHQVDMLLELSPECSTLMFVSSSGLLGSERLASIRDFPEPELHEEQAKAAIDAGLSAESITVQDDRYLPLSDLDLRVLVDDLRAAISRFLELFSGAQFGSLRLTGINSAHPLLADLLETSLSLKVIPCRPLLAPGVTGFAIDQVLVQTGLARLTGLGLALLPHPQLLGFDPQNAQTASSIQDSSEVIDAFHGAPTMEPIPLKLGDRDVSDFADEKDRQQSDHQTGGFSVVNNSDSAGAIDPVIADEPIEVPPQLDQKEQWPSISGEVLADALSEEEFKLEAEEAEVLGSVEEVKAEEQWPSISGGVLADALSEESEKELKLETEEAEVLGTVEEVEAEETWPSISGGALADALSEESEKELKLEALEAEVLRSIEEVEHEETWPSIKGPSPTDALAADVENQLPPLREEELVSSELPHSVEAENVSDNSLQELRIPGVPLNSANSAPKSVDSVIAKKDESHSEGSETSTLGELRFADE